MLRFQNLTGTSTQRAVALHPLHLVCVAGAHTRTRVRYRCLVNDLTLSELQFLADVQRICLLLNVFVGAAHDNTRCTCSLGWCICVRSLSKWNVETFDWAAPF